MTATTADLLSRMRQIVQAEADAQFSALDRQWSRQLGERVVSMAVRGQPKKVCLLMPALYASLKYGVYCVDITGN